MKCDNCACQCQQTSRLSCNCVDQSGEGQCEGEPEHEEFCDIGGQLVPVGDRVRIHLDCNLCSCTCETAGQPSCSCPKRKCQDLPKGLDTVKYVQSQISTLTSMFSASRGRCYIILEQ